jgi:hypothetical protein
MALSDRAARGILLALCLALVTAVLSLDWPKATGGQFWGDGATYHAMAWSLAEDFDLRYEARDVFRIRREFPDGPQGIFLKRTAGGLVFDAGIGFPWIHRAPGGPSDRIYFAKAFAYPMLAAPFVRLFGTNGLLLTNALCLGVALFLGYGELRRRASPPAALALCLALFGATVAPLYLWWLQPEIFNLGLITAGLVAARRRPLLAAVLLGVATYSKPYNLLLAIPLGLAPFVPLLKREGGERFSGALLESARRGAVLALTVIGLFVLNKAVTGELNYQGGERKTFYRTFPFERAADGTTVTFGNSGFWMTTDYLGPLVEGRDDQKESARTGPSRPPDEMRASFLRNLGYFWGGRFAGALPYFFPALMALVLFLVLGPRDAQGWLSALALLASYLFYLLAIPDNWYGGGGTVGNRYFLNLLPLALFLVPRGREWWVAVPGALMGGLFVLPILGAPLRHSLHPGEHTLAGVFRFLPPELTMLNDLSIFTDPWRKKQPFGFMGDSHKGWPADPSAYNLYFLDDGTYGKETRGDIEGFWLRAGGDAEIVLRALDIKPVRRIVVETTGGPLGDVVTARLGSQGESLTLAAGEGRAMALAPGPGFPYYETFLYVLRMRSTVQDVPPDAHGRLLGAFVRIRLELGG